MNLKHLFIALPATLLILGSGVANAGQTIDDVGVMACATDKRDEKEPQHHVIHALASNGRFVWNT